MKFGLIVAGQYLRDAPAEQRAREMLEQVRLARALGFDSLWMVHHYLIEFQAFQPLPMLARLAAETGEMEVGTAVYVQPLQPPVEVAENFATLDALTGGRLVFGVAQGYREVEFDAPPRNPSARRAGDAEAPRLTGVSSHRDAADGGRASVSATNAITLNAAASMNAIA